MAYGISVAKLHPTLRFDNYILECLHLFQMLFYLGNVMCNI